MSPGGLRVLVVEDDPDFRSLITGALSNEDFDVETATDGEQAVDRALAFKPDVIVLDLGLPKLDGIEVCRQIRSFSDAFVIMLTARDDELDKLIGLSIGADDYMTKPFSPRELVARIRAILRRSRPSSGSAPVRRIGDLWIDPAARQARVGDVDIELTRVEFDILDILSENPRVVVPRSRLAERLFGPDRIAGDQVIDTHVSNVRRKLGDDPRSSRYIVTIRGVGYRMGAGA